MHSKKRSQLGANNKAALVIVTVLSVVIGLSACSTVQFYSQAVVGHSRLMMARIPLDKAIEQSGQTEREMLEKVRPILDFAATEIGLPVKGSYHSYVSLERDYPVYVVTAAPEFSLDAKLWCYLVIGCASYRGYFDYSKALQYAKNLQQVESVDVYVRGANAYSTLGWFDDPILPSMLRYGEVYLAELLFHELTHQKIYLNGDTDFNEALASAVAEIATGQWLEQQNENQNLQNADIGNYQQSLQMREDFDALIAVHKSRLLTLYNAVSAVELDSDALVENPAAKQALSEQLMTDYQALKSSKWKGDDRYDNWFNEPVNNARLSGISSYRENVAMFKAMYADCGNDFARFFESLKDKQVDEALAASCH